MLFSISATRTTGPTCGSANRLLWIGNRTTSVGWLETITRRVLTHEDPQVLEAIGLKLGRLKAAHKGQMEFYLGWLDSRTAGNA
jgi:hypothetical protein